MKVGLTGGMGVGKSTVSACLKNFGFQIIKADEIVRDLLKSDGEVIKSVRERWGEAVFYDEKIDTTKISSIVFSQKPEELFWLEHLLHPKVRAIWLKQVESNSDLNWAVEIPLLFENKLEKFLDVVVCVTCSPVVQTFRLKLKGLRENQIKARIARQMPLAEKEKKADFVIMNNGGLDFLSLQVSYFLRGMRM